MEIGLVDAITALRGELMQAMADAETAPIRFRVDSVDLEFQVAITKTAEIGGKIRYWVLSAEGKAGRADQNIHTVKLHLQAATADGGPVHTRDNVKSSTR